MTLILIAIVAMFTLWAAAQAVAPLFTNHEDELRDDMLGADMRQVEELIGRRMLVLDNLRELELDHQMGKLEDEDYAKLRRRYELQALGVIRKLNALYGGEGWESRLDSALVARQRQLGVAEADAPAPAVEVSVEVSEAPEALATEAEAPAVEAETPQEAPALISCHACGASIKATSKFCSECGAPQDDAATGQDAPTSPQDDPADPREDDEGDEDAASADADADADEDASLGDTSSTPLLGDQRAMTPVPDTREANARAEVK